MNKKVITIITIFICITLISVTCVYAVVSQTNNKTLQELKELLATENPSIRGVDLEQQSIDMQYKKAVKQSAALTLQVSQLELSKAQYTRKRENTDLIEKYTFQTEYYNTCLLMKQLDLQNNQISVLNLQINSEEAKLTLGLSTELRVKELKNNRRILQNQIAETANNIEISKGSLKNKLNIDYSESFSPQFVIPSTVAVVNPYVFTTLTDDLINKNIDLETVNCNISYQVTMIQKLKTVVNDYDVDILAANADLSKLYNNQEVLRKDLRLYANQKYYAFAQVIGNVTTRLESKAIYEEKLQVFATEHSEGEISDLDYETAKLNVMKQLFEVDQAIVSYLNSSLEVELASKGIVIK